MSSVIPVTDDVLPTPVNPLGLVPRLDDGGSGGVAGVCIVSADTPPTVRRCPGFRFVQHNRQS